MLPLMCSGNNDGNHVCTTGVPKDSCCWKVNTHVLFALLDTEFYKGKVTEAT